MRVPVAVRALSPISLQAWFTPPPISERRATREKQELTGIERVTIPFENGTLSGFSIGDGPLVLAVHGWGGRAAQMLPLADRLANRGMRVVAINLPGHAGGTKTDVRVAARAITAVIDTFGPPQAVIAHSLGAMVTRLVFEEEAPPLVVFVAPMLVASDALDVFANRARLFPWADRGLRKRLRSWDPELWPRLDDVMIDQLPGAEILILHDPTDPDTPFARSAELAARREGTMIVPLQDQGHTAPLADSQVIGLVADRIIEKVARSASVPADTR